MEIENVLMIFGELSELNENKAAKYRCLCESAVRAVSDRIKNASFRDCKRLEYAAAVTAYYRSTLTLENKDITVGEISVKQPQRRIECAKLLLEQALADISDIYEDRDFVFERI